MFAFNGLQNDPDNLLVENIYRWNHDLKHPHPTQNNKARCRYDLIEVKSIFKPKNYKKIDIHVPQFKANNKNKIVSGIDACLDNQHSFYENLREEKIKNAYLTCNHYRFASMETVSKKCSKSSCLENYRRFKANDFLIADYPEIMDETLKKKAIERNYSAIST